MYSCWRAYLGTNPEAEDKLSAAPRSAQTVGSGLGTLLIKLPGVLEPWGDTSHSAATVGKHLPLARPHPRRGFCNSGKRLFSQEILQKYFLLTMR